MSLGEKKQLMTSRGSETSKPGPSFLIMAKRSITLDDGLRVKQMTQPLKKFSAGQVSCALWENEAKVGDRMVTMLKATVERRYRDSAGNWKSSGSFSRNEIPLAIYGLMKAFVAMVEEKGNGDDNDGG